MTAPSFPRWLLACAGGELAGLGVAGIAGLSAYALFGDATTTTARVATLVIVGVGGLLEGTILATAQAIVMDRLLSSRARFVAATAAVAAAGWLVGTSMPLFFVDQAPPAAEPSLALVVAYAAAFGAVAGVVFGAAQATALAARRRRWIVGNAAGWAFGLPIPYVAFSVAADLGGGAWSATAGAIGGLGAGVAIAVATWIVALRGPRAERDRQSAPPTLASIRAPTGGARGA